MKFVFYLSILYVLWLPLSRFYLIVRLKLSYVILNICGYYPKFDISEINTSQGEMFSFLPFFALMLSTYGKRVLKLWKPILITGVILFAVEVVGRFFEKLYFFNPSVYFISSMSIFFLATARVAIPFISWLVISAEEFKHKK